MSDHPFDDQAKASFESLSALADGQASEHEIAQACAAWRGQEDARAQWHTYQLIGDVMRSESLAQPAQADLAFLDTFRARLAQEPVVLAPAALAAVVATQPEPAVANLSHPLHRRRWAGPAAVAAGFVMVLGAVVTTLQPDVGPAGSSSTALMAQGAQGSREALVPVAAQGWVGQEAALTPALRSGLVADSSMSRHPAEAAQSSFSRNASEAAAERAGNLVIIRDPQLDEFLAAHRELTSSGTFVPPAGLVRSVAFEAPAGR